jgi:hypothetical protein
MLRRKAESFAIWVTMALLSLLVVFVTPILENSRLIDRLIAAALTVPSLGWTYGRVQSLALRYLSRRVRKTWTYVTYPHDESKREGNYGYGIMTFFIDGHGRLRYRVELFDDPSTLQASVEEGYSASGAVGRAHDKSLRYDYELHEMWLIYKVSYNQPGALKTERKGYLYLDFSNANRPQGYWASDLNKSDLSAGEMHVCQPENFGDMVSTLKAN